MQIDFTNFFPIFDFSTLCFQMQHFSLIGNPPHLSSHQWNYDEGHLTNKSQLPVTKINFGGLGQPSSKSREAKFQLGPLYCYGADPGDRGGALRKHGASPASCKDLWLRGHHQVSDIAINRDQEQIYFHTSWRRLSVNKCFIWKDGLNHAEKTSIRLL